MTLDINTATAAELRVFRRGLNLAEATPDQLRQVDELDDLIVDRLAEEKVAALESKMSFREKASKLDKKAYSNWPELNDPESDFAKKVNTYLEEMGGVDSDPVALFNAANAVGVDLGMVPAARREPQGSDPTSKIKGGSGDAPTGTEPKTEFLDRTTKIAAHYADLIDLTNPEVRARLEERASHKEED